jgi:hypothetical protein
VIDSVETEVMELWRALPLMEADEVLGVSGLNIIGF